MPSRTSYHSSAIQTFMFLTTVEVSVVLLTIYTLLCQCLFNLSENEHSKGGGDCLKYLIGIFFADVVVVMVLEWCRKLWPYVAWAYCLGVVKSLMEKLPSTNFTYDLFPRASGSWRLYFVNRMSGLGFANCFLWEFYTCVDEELIGHEH